MHKCPFHEQSSGAIEGGEINSIHCPDCGDYRISEVALQQISNLQNPPRGWFDVVARGQLISTRMTRELFA
ncbi:MAG: hypothetical protein NXH95_16000 [Pseudomonadaceae bacterium]|nr:hypothetical protein [Pseudomonadaceae bacterium]